MKVPMMFTWLGGTQAKPNRRNSSCSWSRTKVLPCSCPRSKSQQRAVLYHKEKSCYEHNYGEGWHDDLLQGLGRGPGRNVFTRLAALLRCMGRSNAFSGRERFPGGRA